MAGILSTTMSSTTLSGTATITVKTIYPDSTITPTYTDSIYPDSTVREFTTWVNHIPTPIITTITDTKSSSSTTSTTTSTTTESQLATTTSTTSATDSVSTTTTPSVTSAPTSSAGTSSTSTPSNQPSLHSSSHGVSNGALAGAIVGSIVGSALLTLLVAFLFFRRRRQSSAPAKGFDSEAKSGSGYSGPVGAALSREKPGLGALFASLATVVPDPADDETVRSRILTLIDQASLHVDNYYVPGLSAPHLSHDAVVKLDKYESAYLPASVATVLEERTVQRQVITHVLVRTLLDAIRPGGQLLPALFTAQPRTQSSTTSNESALFAWRMLSAHLYQQGEYGADPAHAAARSQAAQVLSANFTSAFAPYGLAAFSEEDRMAHLTHLATAAAELGVWLFAQPCTFKFVWDKSTTEFTVGPRVLKTFDEQGKRLVPNQVLVEATQASFSNVI